MFEAMEKGLITQPRTVNNFAPRKGSLFSWEHESITALFKTFLIKAADTEQTHSVLFNNAN